MTPREFTEQREKDLLCEHATLSGDSRGRRIPEPKCELRTDFCRDRDRIVHCKSFRRLKQKTQVFLSPEGDHYRTRLTHTLEVSQIARTICRALRLNEDLTEAIAMGHDLGHTPFGHAGERALDQLNAHGFKHYEQSVRVVEKLEKDRCGLNLTFETIEGIVHHTKGDWSENIEGHAVRHADRIAFLNHDIEDAITAGVLSEKELPREVVERLGEKKSQRITTLIRALVEGFDGQFHFPPDVEQAYDKLYRFMFERIYLNASGGAKAEEHKVEGLIEALFRYYCKEPGKLPEFYQDIAAQEGSERAVTDYISGMTDKYALHCYETLFIPKSWGYASE
jgi:dGTPase